MAVNWTEEQARAIQSQGRTVLVSAAAGSGKTAVLVERIIRRVCDIQAPCDIDRFLIVTFTKAAAAEMRQKISDALTAKLLENPRSRRLRMQLTRLARADILTTDAFCAKLLREHFQAAGLTPDFRVADENEAAALQKEVLENLIEELYEQADENSGFLALVEALSAARNDDRLGAVILECYKKLQSHPFPDRWLAQNLENMSLAASLDPVDSIYGRVILDALAEVCAAYSERLAQACAEIEALPKVAAKYLPAFSQDLARCRALQACCAQGAWDEIRLAAQAASEKPRLGAVTKFEDPQMLENLRDTRAGWHAALEKFTEGPLAHDAEKTRADCAAILPVAQALSDAVCAFDATYSASKRAKNLLDFSDLEHFTLKILIDAYGPDGFTPSGTARQISTRYEEIAVDEFQDSNEVQDLIFRALSREESNLFLVGDVKQSIYGFRLADPGVFLEKYHRFSDDPAPGQSERIILSRNFRSRQEVIESVNYLFKSIFSPALGGIEYKGREALVCAAQYPQNARQENDSEFILLEDPQDGRSRLESEADFLAAKIASMLREGYRVTDRASGVLRPCRPEDFAILLRSMQGRAEVFSAALTRAGIPVYTDNAGQLFDAPEILALMALCEVVDNPQQDIPLATVLHSPIYAFSADALAQIRLCCREGSFYQALCACAAYQDDGAQNPDAPSQALSDNCRNVLEQLSEFRSLSRDERADRLLIHMLHKTNFSGRFGAAYGEAYSRARVNAFVCAASRSEGSGYRGLYTFLNQMRALRDGRGLPSPAEAAGMGVQIMSIHKSKGLEFPIVFVANLESAFNLQDLNAPVLIHPRLGAGFKLRPAGRMIEYPTLARHAVSLAMRSEQLSEQMRVLYVALTRAKEKLILIAAGNPEQFVKKHQALALRQPIPAQALAEFSAPLAWLLTPLLRLPAAAQILQDAGYPRAPLEPENFCWRLTVDTPAPVPDAAQPQADAFPAVQTQILPLSSAEIHKRLSYQYPYLQAADLPSKLTATGLKGRFTDVEAQEQARPLTRVPASARLRPRMLSEQTLTPAQRGTALHMAMQFLDFSNTDSEDAIAAQVQDMASRRLLSPAAAEAADTARLLAFFRSPLGIRMRASQSVHREFKFSLLACARAASELSALAVPPAPDEDTILFQGVIDCFFEEGDGLVLIDFKSDRVRESTVSMAIANYRPQLLAYSYALTRITGKPVLARYLYFFNLNREFPIA